MKKKKYSIRVEYKRREADTSQCPEFEVMADDINHACEIMGEFVLAEGWELIDIVSVKFNGHIICPK